VNRYRLRFESTFWREPSDFGAKAGIGLAEMLEKLRS